MVILILAFTDSDGHIVLILVIVAYNMEKCYGQMTLEQKYKTSATSFEFLTPLAESTAVL